MRYSVLNKGDTIDLRYGSKKDEKEFVIDIVATGPDDNISCIDTNIEVEFEVEEH